MDNTNRTAQHIAEEIHAKETRLADVTQQATATVERAEVLKDEIGREIANGIDSSEKRAELAAIQDAFDPLNRAIKILEADLQDLHAEMNRATIAEAKAAREQAMQDWGARADELFQAVAGCYSAEVAARLEAVLEASNRATEANRDIEAAGEAVHVRVSERLHDYAASRGSAIPLALALQALSAGHPYSAQWGYSTSRESAVIQAVEKLPPANRRDIVLGILDKTDVPPTELERRLNMV
jgi:DNA repair exonuclease SbcCD ATPase subunit